jgi:predicted dehydrogenase
VRVLIIGAGHGARVYVPALRGITGIDEMLLASGRVGRMPSAPEEYVRPVADWNAALRDEVIDACVVVVPSFCQFEVASRVFQSEIPTLLEKPGGHAPDEAASLWAMLGDRVGVGYSLRFMRGLQQLLLDVRDGAVGRVRRISIQWITQGWSQPEREWTWRCDASRAGGVLYEFASHCFDYLQFLSSFPVQSLYCSTSTYIPNRRDALGESKAVTSPDTVDLLLRHEDGCITQASIMTSAEQGVGNRLEVFGTEGHVSWFHPAPFRPGSEVYMSAFGPDQEVCMVSVPEDPADTRDTRVPATRRMLEAFLGRVKSDKAPSGMPAASLLDARQALRLVQAAELSAARGVQVQLTFDDQGRMP